MSNVACIWCLLYDCISGEVGSAAPWDSSLDSGSTLEYTCNTIMKMHFGPFLKIRNVQRWKTQSPSLLYSTAGHGQEWPNNGIKVLWDDMDFEQYVHFLSQKMAMPS